MTLDGWFRIAVLASSLWAMLVDAWLPRAAALHPGRTALETSTGALAYAELAARAETAAGALAERGVGRGDRVAIALSRGEAFAIALHACLRLGAPAVPIDLRLTARERARRAAGARLVIDAPLDESAGPAPPTRHDLDAVALVIHTSGTTAGPKAVELTYGNLLASALGSAVALGLHPAERWLCCLPLAHIGGLSILVRSAIYATTAVVHERFEAAAVVRALSREGMTLVSLVPTTLRRSLDAGLREPTALRCALIGGGPASPALMARATEAGVPVAQTYGMSEACSQITTSLPGEAGSAGRALVGALVEIAPDREILVAGPTVSPGAVGVDGWLHTGDLGALDERGRLTVTGRKAELIVTGGENVSPAEVEAVLLEHPRIADAGVHARPDPEWGEAVIATLVADDGNPPDAADLRAHCASRLASYKVPKAFAWADELPRTASGKLLRREL